ncbi:efflux transporter outer membrane subunit [Acetobacter tropicalis]|uniref:efflux transporter outer membrane subunit n=1 Tax=Acetobacter TaxID=434 RepID=UPI00128AF086|nr:efflux transporter outer membrane subunit [Acetobacter senegalensis]MCG4256294.1 efflux transporter outer membrane subunit [Acetobacter senegalensis]MCG4266148.1 efflux transporter outer membrane subunit [Acetobacter senegalensis]MPQ72741.1 efflux transporter outer membrane subunit [Acetobacter senegalensis]
MSKHILLKGTTLAALTVLSACDLAPTYQAPHFIVPASWHGQGLFREAQPQDTVLRSDWWTLFADPTLTTLETQATESNADLQAAAERFIQARAIVMEARSDLLPHFALAFGSSDNKSSADRLFRYKGPITATDEYYGGLASWEPDIWSAIRNRVRAQKYYAQEQAAQYAAARLSLQAEVATDYFALRGLDAQNAIYSQSISYYQQALHVTQTRLDNQDATGIDVARAKNQLYMTQARQLDVQAQREVLEHALAVLVNASPSSFHIPAVAQQDDAEPTVPLGLPSELLQRRPDIAVSEREMAQANRTIGIARAAFYPHVSFNANGGFDGNGFDLANLANSMWSYGASATMPLFEGGLRRAQLQRSWSAYRETRDHYRMTVLSAFRDVENGLSLTARLRAENVRLKQAVDAAMQSQTLTMTLYKGGADGYLDALIAQVNTLDARIEQAQIQARALQASVGLVRALGGGWQDKLLPTPNQTMTFTGFQYEGLRHPTPAGGIDIPASPEQYENLDRAGPSTSSPQSYDTGIDPGENSPSASQKN